VSQEKITFASSSAVDSTSGDGAITAANIAANQAKAMNDYKNNSFSTVTAVSALSTTFLTERLQGQESVDVEMSFVVSSPEPLDNAYLVVVANFGTEDKVARQVSARALKRIDDKPQRIVVNQSASLSGLPFKKFDVALYANGQEVATNLSEKQMALTSDQAYQFFMLTHIASHTGATLPPIPMLMLPRAEFRRQLETVEASQPIFVKVDKTGSVLALSGGSRSAERPVCARAAKRKPCRRHRQTHFGAVGELRVMPRGARGETRRADRRS
jgi:hypothetical protein